MDERRWSDRLLYFIAGAAMGSAVALLFAPKSGAETREFISQKARDAKGGIKDYMHRGKEMISHEKQVISHAIEAGKQAYKEERQKKAEHES